MPSGKGRRLWFSEFASHSLNRINVVSASQEEKVAIGKDQGHARFWICFIVVFDDRASDDEWLDSAEIIEGCELTAIDRDEESEKAIGRFSGPFVQNGDARMN